jgi:hypothetical protein
LKPLDVRVSRLIRGPPDQVFDQWFDPSRARGTWHGARKAIMNRRQLDGRRCHGWSSAVDEEGQDAKAQGIGCCQRANSRRGLAAGGVLFAGLAVLMPKCPMCIAARLGVLGLSGLAAHVDPRALWLAVALAVAASGALLVHRLAGRRRDHEARNGNT